MVSDSRGSRSSCGVAARVSGVADERRIPATILDRADQETAAIS
jgi:hypothetical protein